MARDALADASGNLFNGGSSESTMIGIDIIYPRCRRNRFVNVCVKRTRERPCGCTALQNSFSNCYFNSPTSLPNAGRGRRRHDV